MQIEINHVALAIILVALLLLFGPERAVGFGRDLQKALRDFVGIFRR